VSLLAATKARYTQAAVDARRQAVLNLQNVLPVPSFGLGEWSNRVAEAYADQWPPEERHPDFSWNWPEIQREGRTDPTKFDVVLWGQGTRLCCLATASLSTTAVCINFLEGDPRRDCPFRGRRTLIVLEAIQCYGLATGRREMRIEPVNDALVTLYRDNYGFSLATPEGGSAYYRREFG
jgi:hypothetical protein